MILLLFHLFVIIILAMNYENYYSFQKYMYMSFHAESCRAEREANILKEL